MDYNLIIDTENRQLLTGYTSTEVGTPPVIIYGDKPTISVRLVKANDNNSEWPWRDDGDLTGQTIRVGVGAGLQPSAGQYTLLYGGDETTALDYNASDSDVSTAINLLPSIIAAGGVSVENVDGTMRFTFTDDGARTGITANVDNIYPTSSTSVYEVVEGDGSTASVQHLIFESSLCAYVELTDDVASPTSSVTTIREGVLNTTSELQRIQLLNNPIKGSYTITIGAQTTTPLDVDSNIDSIVDAVEAMQQFEVGDIIATGTTHDYTLEFDKSLGDVGEATLNMDNIQGADVGKTGEINLHTTGIAELLADNNEAEATLEVVRWTTADSAGETVLQLPVMVRQDIIPDSPPAQTPMPTYATINLDQINQSGATSGQIPTWNGSEWVPTTVAGTGDMLSTNNLSDVADAPTALSNLGAAAASHTHTAGDIDAEASADGYVLTSDGAGNAAWEASTGGGASQLSDLSDVNTSTPTNRNVLVADGVDFESRALTEADISDLTHTPDAHAASHTDGTDDIQDATNAQKGLATAAQITDLEANTAARHDEVSIAASGGRDYVTISGNQQLTLHDIDLTSEVTGDLPITEGGTGASDAATARTNLGVDAAGTDNSTDVTITGEDFLSLSGQQITANAIDLDNLSATGTPSGTTFLRGDNTWATPAGGGGGLTQTAGSDADVAMAVGNLYVVDMSAWTTADRVYSLPTTAAAGDQIGITIKAGSAAHTLDIQTTTASNDTINGVDHDSTPWSKLFQTGETVILECVTANTDWLVVEDGRIACHARLEKTNAQTMANTAFDQIEYNSEVFNMGMTTNTSTTWDITVRRAGFYQITAHTALDDTELTFVADDYFYNALYIDGSSHGELQMGNVGATNTNQVAASFISQEELNADQAVSIYTFVNGTTGADLFLTNRKIYMTVTEIL